MKLSRELPPVELLRTCLDYDPTTGDLRWKERPRVHFTSDREWRRWNTRYSGQPTFLKRHPAGYRTGIIHFGGRKHELLAHRVIWKLITGEEPPAEIDHRDRNKAHNRWTNLRVATSSENKSNVGPRADNALGIKGVHRHSSGMFVAKVQKNKQSRHLGYFKTVEEASAAYAAASKLLHGEFTYIASEA